MQHWENKKTSRTDLRKAKREDAIETIKAEDKSFVHRDNFEIKVEQKESELELENEDKDIKHIENEPTAVWKKQMHALLHVH